MTVLALVAVCAAMFTGGGCQLDQQKRIELLEKAVTVAQQKVQEADGQIAYLQKKLELARLAFDNPALPADQRAAVQSTIDKVSGALASAVEYRTMTAEVLKETQTAIEQAKANPSGSGELDIVTALVQSITSRLGPKAAAWGSLAAIALSIVAAAMQRKKATGAIAEADAAHTDACNAIDEAGEIGEQRDLIKATAKAIITAVEALPDEQRKAVKTAVGQQMKEVAAKTPDVTYNGLNAVVDQLKAA
jgi:hypothetical protein